MRFVIDSGQTICKDNQGIEYFKSFTPVYQILLKVYLKHYKHSNEMCTHLLTNFKRQQQLIYYILYMKIKAMCSFVNI